MEKKNNYIVSKGFYNYFKTLIIAVVSEQLCLTMNMVFAGQLVSADAFSALDLAIPVESLLSGILLLLVGGAAAPASRYVGNQEFSRAHKVLTSSLIVASGVAVLIAVLSLVFIDSIVSILCDNAALSGYLKDYLEVYFITFIPMTVATAFSQMVDIDGKPAVATSAVVATGVLDIVLDVVLLKCFDMGVAAVAWSDFVSYVLMAAIILPFLFKKGSQFRFEFAGRDFVDIQKENLASGVSYCIPSLTLGLLVFFVNSTVLKSLGVQGLYVWSVGYQLLSIIVMLMNCIGGTVLVTMGSMFAGCGEMDSLRYLSNKCMNISLEVILVLIAVVSIFPHTVLSLFGQSVEVAPHQESWLRMIIFFALPYGICSLRSYLAQAIGNVKGAIIPFALFIVVFFCFFLASANFNPEMLFAAMAGAGLIYLIGDLVYCSSQNIKHPDKSLFFLIPSDKSNHSLFRSVPYSVEGLKMALEDTDSFLETCDIDPSLCGGINLCCEELAMNIIEKNKAKGAGYSFDLFIVEDSDDVKVTIKDAGAPFNPVMKFDGTAADALAEGKDMELSLRLVNSLCKTLRYNYMYGQNAIYMTFSKNPNGK